jgi:hypothetical protein
VRGGFDGNASHKKDTPLALLEENYVPYSFGSRANARLASIAANLAAAISSPNMEEAVARSSADVNGIGSMESRDDAFGSAILVGVSDVDMLGNGNISNANTSEQGWSNRTNQSKSPENVTRNDRLERLVEEHFGVNSVCASPSDEGQQLGCNMGCSCGNRYSKFVWTCYPYYVGVTDVLPDGNKTTVYPNLGECSISAFGLVILSVCIISSCLVCFVSFLLHMRRLQRVNQLTADRETSSRVEQSRRYVTRANFRACQTTS